MKSHRTNTKENESMMIVESINTYKKVLEDTEVNVCTGMTESEKKAYKLGIYNSFAGSKPSHPESYQSYCPKYRSFHKNACYVKNRQLPPLHYSYASASWLYLPAALHQRKVRR